MTRADVQLMIADGVLALSAAPRRSTWEGLWGGQTGPAQTLRFPFETGGPEEALVEGLLRLRADHPWPKAEVTATALLGMAVSRVGLIRRAQGSTGRSRLEGAQVHGWIEHHWRIDPSTQIIRWANQRSGGDVLVSCVDLAAHQAILSACERTGLRLASCEPTLLARSGPVSILNFRPEFGPDPADCVVAYTEEAAQGHRSPALQLVHFHGGKAAALWRGWVPPKVVQGADMALLGAAQRFMAAKGIAQNGPVQVRHWQLGDTLAVSTSRAA